jgi:hypothetical protein
VKDKYWKAETKKPIVIAIVPKFPQISAHKLTPSQIARYCGSFQAKDFKAFAQLGPMIIFQILKQLEVDSDDIEKHVRAWKAVSRMSKLLYQRPPYVINLNHHLECIDKTSKDLLNAFEEGFPMHKGKTKIHIINHIVTAVENYGPLSNFDAEKNESKNGAIRNMIVNSNRQNNSRDVAIKMSLFEGIQHLSSGGISINDDNSREEPGLELLSLFQEREMKEILGIKPPKGIPKIKSGHFYFYRDNGTERICLVNSKIENAFKMFSLSPATQGGEYDRFDNQRLVLNSNLQEDVLEADILHEANVLHDCSDLCKVTTGPPIEYSHAVNDNYVLNSYSFSKNHTGRLDSQ